MKIKFILLASVVALSGISAANAADAIQYQEPAPTIAAPSFSWTGGYAGAHVGYGWGKSDFGYPLNDGDLKPNGFLGGVYAGYNFALENNVVLGVDADATYNNRNWYLRLINHALCMSVRFLFITLQAGVIGLYIFQIVLEHAKFIIIFYMITVMHRRILAGLD